MADQKQAIGLRDDLMRIADLVEPGARVLDVGCSSGELLAYLAAKKGADAREIEIRPGAVAEAVASGLSVIQGDADNDLQLYPDDSFDYVVLSRTITDVEDPQAVLRELVRIGKRAIVGLPNYGYWRLRMTLLLTGRMPVNRLIGDAWFSSGGIHLCTIADFVELADDLGLSIHRGIVLDGHGHVVTTRFRGPRANLFGQEAIFLLERPGQAAGG